MESINVVFPIKRFSDNIYRDEKINAIDKIAIIKKYRDVFDPNINDVDGFGAEWFLFESLCKQETYGELFERIAERTNELILIDWDENGTEIIGDTVAKDYLWLLGFKIAQILDYTRGI